MLNDKSEIKKCREIYQKYNIVDSYDDEYDDTYDSHNVGGNVLDDSTEIDARSFTIPRVSFNILIFNILSICKLYFLYKFFFRYFVHMIKITLVPRMKAKLKMKSQYKMIILYKIQRNYVLKSNSKDKQPEKAKMRVTLVCCEFIYIIFLHKTFYI